jgi:hypothetical protein
MIDLHTHMLPDWDDGAKTWEDARRSGLGLFGAGEESPLER